MEIPTEGGALFEVADQQFLQLPLGDGNSHSISILTLALLTPDLQSPSS